MLRKQFDSAFYFILFIKRNLILNNWPAGHGKGVNSFNLW